MAAEITRLLIFRSKDLGKDSVFVLTFENEELPGVPGNPEKDKDNFSAAFKVTTFGATGPYTLRVLYNSKIGVARVQLPGEIIVPASTYTPIDAGQKTTLTKMGSPPLYSFSKPTAISPSVDQMVAVNGTSDREIIGFGFLERLDREIPQMLFQANIDPSVEVAFQFSPILKGYMTWDFQDNGIISGSIRSNILFNEDLSKLDPVTNWRVTYNKESDTYAVSPDNVGEDEI